MVVAFFCTLLLRSLQSKVQKCKMHYSIHITIRYSLSLFTMGTSYNVEEDVFVCAPILTSLLAVNNDAESPHRSINSMEHRHRLPLLHAIIGDDKMHKNLLQQKFKREIDFFFFFFYFFYYFENYFNMFFFSTYKICITQFIVIEYRYYSVYFLRSVSFEYVWPKVFGLS
jgi:hypothetical protein